MYEIENINQRKIRSARKEKSQWKTQEENWKLCHSIMNLTENFATLQVKRFIFPMIRIIYGGTNTKTQPEISITETEHSGNFFEKF